MNDNDLVGRFKIDNCTVNKDGVNKCSFCEKVFKRVEMLTEHLKVHKFQTLMDKFKCKYCSVTYVTKMQFQLHVALYMT